MKDLNLVTSHLFLTLQHSKSAKGIGGPNRTHFVMESCRKLSANQVFHNLPHISPFG